jgi:hypothetical protein
MYNFNQLLSDFKKRQWQKNIDDVKYNADVKADKLMYRLSRHIEKTGLSISVDELCERVKTDDLVASFFCCDPKRQNICEIMQIDYMKYLGFNIKKSTIRIDKSKKSKYPIKSIDVEIDDKYGMLKHIDENGGAQDNQYNDLINFCNYADDEKILYYVVISGAYFTPKKLLNFQNRELCILVNLNKSIEDILSEHKLLILNDINVKYIESYIKKIPKKRGAVVNTTVEQLK